MHTDTRPRFKYQFPDGRVGIVIRDHGDQPPRRIDLELVPSDPPCGARPSAARAPSAGSSG